MNTEQSHMIDRILNLTLEVLYLLTGEKCAVVKLVSIEGLLQGMYPPILEGRGRGPTREPPPSYWTPERNNDKKILEVTQKIIELLTGETLLEECRSVRKKVTMENQQTLTSPDLYGRDEMIQTSSTAKEESDPPEEHALYEGGVQVEVDCTMVKEEDLLDGDCWTPRALPSAKILEDVPPNADVSDTERWSPTALIKKEINGKDSTSPPIVKKIILEHNSGQMSFTSSLMGNGMGREGIGDRNEITAQSASPPRPLSQSAGATIYSCDGCKKIFTSFSDFLHHQSMCRGPPSIFCVECGKSFLRREQLVRHRLIHTGPKRYACPECEKTFRTKSQLVVHQRVHTGEKPFACDDCGRCFARRQLLDSHKVIHSGERPFACSECQMTFSRTSHLIIHQRIHSGEKPYSCSECDRCFRTRSALVAHQRTHTGERPYPCLVCGKCYTHSSHLVVHQRSHSGEKPYSCLECGKSFAHKSGLVRHQRIHTRPKSRTFTEDLFQDHPSGRFT